MQWLSRCNFARQIVPHTMCSNRETRLPTDDSLTCGPSGDRCWQSGELHGKNPQQRNRNQKSIAVNTSWNWNDVDDMKLTALVRKSLQMSLLLSEDRSFFRFITIHAFDRQTDGQTEFSSLDRICIPCSTIESTMTNLCRDVCWCSCTGQYQSSSCALGKIYVLEFERQ